MRVDEKRVASMSGKFHFLFISTSDYFDTKEFFSGTFDTMLVLLPLVSSFSFLLSRIFLSSRERERKKITARTFLVPLPSFLIARERKLPRRNRKRKRRKKYGKGRNLPS